MILNICLWAVCNFINVYQYGKRSGWVERRDDRKRLKGRQRKEQIVDREFLWKRNGCRARNLQSHRNELTRQRYTMAIYRRTVSENYKGHKWGKDKWSRYKTTGYLAASSFLNANIQWSIKTNLLFMIKCSGWVSQDDCLLVNIVCSLGITFSVFNLMLSFHRTN